MNIKIKIINISIIFIFIFLYYYPAYSLDSINRKNRLLAESTQQDELDDIEKPRIITKVYKSTDPYFEYLDEDTNTDPTLETDVINKQELIYNRGKNKIKYIPKFRKEAIDQNIVNKKILFLPWIGLLILILFLSFIFKYLLKNKHGGR